jgi:signal transduction histidine kinase
MNRGVYLSSRTDPEQTIALARAILACASLLAVWLDPAEPLRFAELTYTLHAIYVIYAAVLAVLTRVRRAGVWLPMVTHVIDILAFSVFQLLSLGPSSPFFVYFIFSLFCAAIRWGWRATLWNAAVVVSAYLFMTVSMTRRVGILEFELNRAIIRTFYLIVSAGLLVYLGLYEQRLRDEIERLARWPSTAGLDVEHACQRIIDHAARIVGAERAWLIWTAGDEPAVLVYEWSRQGSALIKHPPGADESMLPPNLADAAFVRTGPAAGSAPLMVSGARRRPVEDVDLSKTPLLGHLHDAVGLASARFWTERVSGRVFFGDLGAPGTELVALTEIVAREIGVSLEQVQVAQHLAEIAAREERIRVARDLHDGVLQSLTGIRFEIRAVASTLSRSGGAAHDRLLALERALAIEQRELRLFIGDLGPPRPLPAGDTLASRLEALDERIALQWKVPVTINIARNAAVVPHALTEAVPLMVHEAVVNALKHAEPSRVAVTVDKSDGQIRIVVADDGRGFAFKGRYEHAALVEMRQGPRSLLDRVASLGGELTIESSAAGTRVEMRLSL